MPMNMAMNMPINMAMNMAMFLDASSLSGSCRGAKKRRKNNCDRRRRRAAHRPGRGTWGSEVTVSVFALYRGVDGVEVASN